MIGFNGQGSAGRELTYWRIARSNEPLIETLSVIGINKEPSLGSLLDMAVLVITHIFWFLTSRSLFFFNGNFWLQNGHGMSDGQGVPMGNLVPGNQSQTSWNTANHDFLQERAGVT